MSHMTLEQRFGQSAVFVASTLMENGGIPQSATPESLLKEAIHVISCGYEDKTDWGSEVCRLLLPFLLQTDRTCQNTYDALSAIVLSVCRLDGFMALSLKISLQDSKCMLVVGGRFTAYQNVLPLKGRRLSIFQID